MHWINYSVRLKNFIKIKYKKENAFYYWMQSVYKKFIFPLEKAVGKNETSFESTAALHMCSLLPKKTLDVVIKNYRPETWLDVGCGTGSSLKYVKTYGIKILGLENSELAIKESKLENVIKKYDLTAPLNLNEHFSVAWCYEVAEHLPEEAADTLIDTLINHSDCIVLSAAVPGQGGVGHINEQPHLYWISKMKNKGYRIDENITAEIHSLKELFSQNVYCFIKHTNQMH